METETQAMRIPKHIARPTSETEALEIAAYREARKAGLV